MGINLPRNLSALSNINFTDKNQKEKPEFITLVFLE